MPYVTDPLRVGAQAGEFLMEFTGWTEEADPALAFDVLRLLGTAQFFQLPLPRDLTDESRGGGLPFPVLLKALEHAGLLLHKRLYANPRFFRTGEELFMLESQRMAETALRVRFDVWMAMFALPGQITEFLAKRRTDPQRRGKRKPLFAAIRRMAKEMAWHDQRFDVVRVADLADHLQGSAWLKETREALKGHGVPLPWWLHGIWEVAALELNDQHTKRWIELSRTFPQPDFSTAEQVLQFAAAVKASQVPPEWQLVGSVF